MWSVMSGRNWLWTLFIASLAFNVGFGATFGVRTYRHACGGATGGCPGGAALLARLNLTEEQQRNFVGARERLVEQIEGLRQRLTAERERLVDLLTAPGPDRAVIAAQLDTIANLQRGIQQRVAEHVLEERSLLSPEQERDFNEILHTRLCPLGCDAAQSLTGCRGGGIGAGHGPCGAGAGSGSPPQP